MLLTLVQAGLSFEDLFFNSSSTAKAEAEVRRYTNVQAVQPFPGGAIMFLAQLFFLKRARYVSSDRKEDLTDLTRFDTVPPATLQMVDRCAVCRCCGWLWFSHYRDCDKLCVFIAASRL